MAIPNRLCMYIETTSVNQKNCLDWFKQQRMNRTVARKDTSKRPQWRLILINVEHLEGFLLEKNRGGTGIRRPLHPAR
jgi:hypothetical protein